MMTVKEALQRASFCLRAAGLGAPRREAEALLTAAMGVSLSRLYAHDDEILPEDTQKRFLDWVERRASGEPYAYLAGEKEFYGLLFHVTPDVLIPRPETEFLVEAVIREAVKARQPRIVDIGAGSGAVAVTLAVRLPRAEITAVDISADALAVAAYNASRHNVLDRVRLCRGDLYTPVAGESFDVVVSNPPYIPAGEIGTLERDVREYEPRLALDGGPDGLLFYRRLTAELNVLGSRPPLLVLEVGYNQADAVADLCRAAGYKKTRQINDLAGIPRIILAQ